LASCWLVRSFFIIPIFNQLLTNCNRYFGFMAVAALCISWSFNNLMPWLYSWSMRLSHDIYPFTRTYLSNQHERFDEYSSRSHWYSPNDLSSLPWLSFDLSAGVLIKNGTNEH
jgi:hypothetical protein